MNLLNLLASFLILESVSAISSLGKHGKKHKTTFTSTPHPNQKSKYVSLNTFKRTSSTLFKRDQVDSDNYDNDDDSYEDVDLGSPSDMSMYYVNVEIGSNKQQITAQLDTGSADFWVFSDDNEYCGYNPDDVQGIANCDRYGVYDFKDSETFELNNTLLLISYGDTTEAKGIMGTDDVSFGDFEISDMSLGVISLSNSSNPVLGIGFKGLQSVYDYSGSPVQYNSLPYLMAEQDIINIPGYSISLLPNGTDANSTITFGAIDTTRYEGNLYKFPVPYGSGAEEPTFLTCVLTGLTMSNSGSNTTIATGSGFLLLDTGSSDSYFPVDVFQFIGNKYFEYNSDYDIYYNECESISDEFLNFNIQGAEFPVPLSSFVSTADEYFQVAHDDWEGTCIFNVGIYDDDQFLLGDTFLRSVYLVADLENEEIALGSTVDLDLSNIGEPNYVEMEDSIPQAIEAPGYTIEASGLIVGDTTTPTDSTSSIEGASTTDASLLFQSQKRKKKSKKSKNSRKNNSRSPRF